MSAITIQQMAGRVDQLLGERLRFRGKGLADKLRRNRGGLPRKVRAAAALLANRAEMARNPRLMQRIDPEEVALAYDLCLRHLNTVNRWDRRKGMVLGIAGSIAFSLLVVAALVVGVLVWRGFV